MTISKSAVIFAAISGAVLLTSSAAAQSAKQISSDESADNSADIADPIQEAEALRQRAIGILRDGNDDNAMEAVALVEESMTVLRRGLGDERPETHEAMNLYALLLREIGQRQEAASLFAEIFRLRRETLGERHPDTLTAMNNHGIMLGEIGKPLEGEPVLGEAYRLRREVLGDKHIDSLESLNNHANALQDLGRLAEAEPLFAKSLELHTKAFGDRHPNTLVSMSNYASILGSLGRFSEAKPMVQESVLLTSELYGAMHRETLSALSGYGALLQRMGEPLQAEPILQSVLNGRTNVLGAGHPDTIAASENYAVVLNALGRSQEAEPLLAEAYRFNKQSLGESHPDTLLSLTNYASVIKAQGRVLDAAPLFEEALRLYRETLGDRHPLTMVSLNNYASMLSASGREAAAEPLYAETLKARRELLGDRHPDTLLSLNNHAFVLDKLGRPQEAAPLFAEALQLRRTVLGDRHSDTLSSMFNSASFLLDIGQQSQSLSLIRELAIATRARADDLGSADAGARGTAQNERELPDRQTIEGFFADIAWANYADAQAGGDETGINRREMESLQTEVLTALQLASAGASSGAVREAAALRFASDLGLQEIVAERRELIARWTWVEAELVKSRSALASALLDSDSLRGELTDIEARIAVIDKRLQAEAPQYFAILNNQAVGLSDLRGVLQEGEAALFLVPARYGTHIMAVTDSDIQWARVPLDPLQAEAAVNVFRRGLEIIGGEAGLPLFDMNQAHDLYQQLIEPVEGALQDTSRLYVIAGGYYSRLPLATLIASKPQANADASDPAQLRAADWLADRYAIVQVPSLQSLVYVRSFRSESANLDGPAYKGFGNPVLLGQSLQRSAQTSTAEAVDAAGLQSAASDTGGAILMDPAALNRLSKLPGTRDELEQVRTALGAPETSVFLDARMTEPAFRSADLSETRILHLATHGLTSDESGSLAEPGLVFTPPESAGVRDDGYLAASEIVGMDLQAADWVILSACNTAAPSASNGGTIASRLQRIFSAQTGLSGLTQAFLYAGADSLLVSHWPVFDDIAPVLTLEVLKRAESGQPRAEALQAAMRIVRDDPELDAAHPAVWAPFILVGEGS